MNVRPLHMWIEDVQRTSGVRRSEFDSPEWRKRFKLWQNTGETVESAAAMLRVWPWLKPSATPVGAELRSLRERIEKIRKGNRE